jgi:hypothetical protein
MKKALLIAFALLALVGSAKAGSISLRRSETAIRDAILKLTPLGSPASIVLTVITKERWDSDGLNSHSGFLKQEAGKKTEVVGVTSVRANLGHQWTFPFLTTDVAAFWAFDKEGRLIDVWIWKTVDAP